MSNVQAGVVQLAIAGLLIAAWYSGTWQVIVDELVAGIAGTGTPRRFGAPSGAPIPKATPTDPGGGGGSARAM